MILDKRLVQDGISVQLLAKLIHKHEYRQQSKENNYTKLMDYYKGKHEILHRTKDGKGLANNKIVFNHAKYITDMSTAYLIGNPVAYSVDDEFDIEALKNTYLEQGMTEIDTRLVKQASIFGRAYERIYATADGEPRSVLLDPRQTFVVYSSECDHKPLLGVYYYKNLDLDGNITGVTCNVYTDTELLKYEGVSDNWNTMELKNSDPHYFGDVPLIEYINNDEKQGDYEQLIPAIDAYNRFMSDRVNDKEQFVDSFLFLKNIEVDSDQAQKLKAEKILMSDVKDGDARYLSKVFNEADMKVLRDDYKEEIYRLAMVPDMSDMNFGNNQSGVAIRYKLMAFEQHTKDKQACIVRGLKMRFKMYNAFLCMDKRMKPVPIHRVDVTFTHNLPVNNYEISQMITNLDGRVPNETLISQLDFIQDPKKQAELAQKEKADEYRRRIDENTDLAEGGGY